MTSQSKNNEGSQSVTSSGCCGARQDHATPAPEVFTEKRTQSIIAVHLVQDPGKAAAQNTQKRGCCCG